MSCGFCKKGATRSQEQRQPQMETFRNTLGGRLEIDRNKVHFYARRTSSLCGCRSQERRTTARAGLGWIHVRKTRNRFLNMLRLLCLTLTLDFSFLFCLLLHFLMVLIFYGEGKEKGEISSTRARARGEKETASGFPVVLNFAEKYSSHKRCIS